MIDFERFPDGSPACDRCPVNAEFASAGIRLAFRSRFVPDSAATLVGSGAYDPPGEEDNHSVTSHLSDRGFFPGVLVLRLAHAPRRVGFRLRGPASVRRFEVRAYAEGDGGDPLPGQVLDRGATRAYGASRGGLFREEMLVLESGSGIARVELDGTGPPGHILLVDDLWLGTPGAPLPQAVGTPDSR